MADNSPDTPIVGEADPQGKTQPGELHIELKTKPVEAKKMAAGTPDAGGAPSAGIAPETGALMQEAAKRGILTPLQKQLYGEAVRRGLIPGPAKTQEPKIGSEVDADTLQEALRDPAGTAGKVVKGAVQRTAQQRQQAMSTFRALRGFDPSVDYDTGASWKAKVAVKESDNPTEARMALENLYGKGNAQQDKGGRWWVVDKGKKVAVFPETFTGALAEGAAGLEATAPEALGMIVGGVAGAPGGPPGVVLGAGTGAAAGKGLAEGSKAIRGFEAKTPGEIAGSVGKAGAYGAGFEAGGQTSGAIGRGIMNQLRSKFFEVTPESQAMTENLLRSGASPPMKTAGPGAKAFQYKQQLRNMVKGDPKAAQNLQFANQRLYTLLQQANIPDSEIREVFAEIIDPRRAASFAKEGRVLAGGVAEYIGGLEREANAALDTAKLAADQLGATLDQITMQAPAENVHQLFNEAATQSRRRFGAAMSRLYEAIDVATGGAPIVPTLMIKQAARDVLDNVPRRADIPGTPGSPPTMTRVQIQTPRGQMWKPQLVPGKPNIPGREGYPLNPQPTLFEQIMQLPDTIPIKNAQRLRTQLREEADSGNLTPGTIEHDYGEVERAVDASMDPTIIEDQASLPAEALRALKKADAMYKEGVQKYKDRKLNQMLRDYREQKVLNPEKFAASLFDTDSTFRIKSFQQIVGPEVWKSIQAADARNMLRSARRLATDPENANRIDGGALFSILKSRGERLDAIYGKPVADQWRQYAERLAALDGKIDVRALTPDRFSNALMTAVTLREKLEDFVKNDVLRALRRGGPEEVDAAVNLLTRPGQEAELAHIIRFFGPESPEVASLRQAAIKKALNASVTRDITGLSTRIAGENIDAWLKRYSRAEQEMLFPHGLATDLRIVADEMKALFPESYQDMGASLAAAGIKGKVPLNLYADWRWLVVSFDGWLADHPAIIRTIAGLEGERGVVSRMRQATLKIFWRQFLQEQAQSISSTAQRPARAQ